MWIGRGEGLVGCVREEIRRAKGVSVLDRGPGLGAAVGLTSSVGAEGGGVHTMLWVMSSPMASMARRPFWISLVRRSVSFSPSGALPR